MGVNELRVVSKIEESLSASKGPRIQIIKSRELKNARSFAEKVFRVLKLHGYKLQPLNKGNINNKVEKSSADSLTVYTIDEPTIKEILGDAINTEERPIRVLFHNSMLSYLKAPVLIVVVSDEFYGETGLQSYAQSLSANEGSDRAQKGSGKRSAGPERNRATPISLSLAAIAFLASGLDAVFGNYIVIGSSFGDFYPLPILILLISIAAIVGRAISLGYERDSSIPLVVASIILFIALTLLQLFAGLMPEYVNRALNLFQVSLFSYSLPTAELALAAFLYILAMLRFVLYLGKGSGKAAYAMTIFGILWITFIIVMNVLQAFAVPVTFPTSLNFQPISTNLPTDFPIFGFDYRTLPTGTPEYMVPVNDLVLIGNLIMGVGLLLAAKAQKVFWSAAKKPSEGSAKSSA